MSSLTTVMSTTGHNSRSALLVTLHRDDTSGSIIKSCNNESTAKSLLNPFDGHGISRVIHFLFSVSP